MFKVNNKDARPTTLISFQYRYYQTRIVGFPQPVNGRKDENPTRKTCGEYLEAHG